MALKKDTPKGVENPRVQPSLDPPPIRKIETHTVKRRKARATKEAPPIQLPPWMQLSPDELANCARLVRLMREEEYFLRYFILWLMEWDARESEGLSTGNVRYCLDNLESFEAVKDKAEQFAPTSVDIRSHPSLRWTYKKEDLKDDRDYVTYRTLAQLREELPAEDPLRRLMADK